MIDFSELLYDLAGMINRSVQEFNNNLNVNDNQGNYDIWGNSLDVSEHAVNQAHVQNEIDHTAGPNMDMEQNNLPQANAQGYGLPQVNNVEQLRNLIDHLFVDFHQVAGAPERFPEQAISFFESRFLEGPNERLIEVPYNGNYYIVHYTGHDETDVQVLYGQASAFMQYKIQSKQTKFNHPMLLGIPK